MAVAVAVPLSAGAGLWRTIGSWQYLPSGSRDSRLDLLRGYLILAMVVDHIGGSSWLYAVTGGGQFVVSAAEGFVFLSGLVMGMVYQKVIRRDGLRAAQRKALGRGLKLYALHAILTLGFAAASSIAGAPWHTPIEDRLGYVVGVLTLRQTYFLTDVLHLYAVLILATPVALLLLARGRTPLLLLTSGLLWAAYQRLPGELSFVTGNASFPAAAWQLFFFTALALGYHRPRVWAFLGRVPRTPAVMLLSGAAAALVAQQVSGGTLFLTGGVAGQSYEQLFYKWDVHPGRLIAAAIFFPLAYLLVTAAWRPLQAGLGWALLPLGQNSLFAYSLHPFVVLMAAIAVPLIPGFDNSQPALNTPVQLAGVVALWCVVRGRLLLSIMRSGTGRLATVTGDRAVLAEAGGTTSTRQTFPESSRQLRHFFTGHLLSCRRGTMIGPSKSERMTRKMKRGFKTMVATLGAGLLLGTFAVGAAFAADPSATTPTDYHNVFTGKVAQVVGVDQQKLTDAHSQARTDIIDQMVKDGAITEDQAKFMKDRIALVGTYGGPMHGGMWGGRFGGAWWGATAPAPAQ